VTRYANLPPTLERARACAFLGDLLDKGRQTEAALEAHENALAVYRARQDVEMIAHMHLKMGHAYQRAEKLAEADQSYHRAIHTLEELEKKDERLLARAYIQKGSLDSQRRM